MEDLVKELNKLRVWARRDLEDFKQAFKYATNDKSLISNKLDNKITFDCSCKHGVAAGLGECPGNTEYCVSCDEGYELSQEEEKTVVVWETEEKVIKKVRQCKRSSLVFLASYYGERRANGTGFVWIQHPHDSRTGPVCDDLNTDRVCSLVCQDLGYRTYKFCRSSQQISTGTYGLDNNGCSNLSYIDSLSDCNYLASEWNRDDCSSSEAIYTTCSD